MSFLPTKIHEDKFNNQDSDSYSSSESDGEWKRSHRKVRSSSQREVFSSNRREIRSSRKQQSSKPSHERYRSGERRKPEGTRDKNKTSGDSERERSRAKRKPSKRSQRVENEERERKDSEEQDRKDNKQERKSSSSKGESAKEKTDKEEERSDETKDASSPGIKVKTLEEILREKALKKLEERRTQGKVQKDTSEGKPEEKLNDVDKEGEKVEEVAGVTKSESNEETVLSDGKDNNSSGSVTEMLITTRKVSAIDQKSPVKKVIKTKKISITDKDNTSVESSTEKTITSKRILANAEDTQGGEEKAKSNEPPSPFQQVRVKSFEEIMQEKRKRKAEDLRESPEDVGGEATASIPGQVNSSTSAVTSIPPKRLKRIVRKSSGDSDKDAKVVSSSGAEGAVSEVKPRRKRTVYVMDEASPSKDSKENGVSSTATKDDNKSQQINLKKAAAAERLGTQKVKVKSFEEIMAEKRQRASQENVEIQKSREVPDQEENRPNNGLKKIQQTKSLKTARAHVIKPRKIKVWTQGTSKVKVKEDDVSSSTTDVAPTERDPQDQAVPSNVETSKLASIRSDTSEAESVVTPGLTLTVDQVPISQPTIPDKASYISEVTPVEDASVRLHGGDYDKILVDSASKEAESSPETTAMDQDSDGISSSLEKPQDSLSDHHGIDDSNQPMEQQPTELKESKEPPSYDDIKQAIANQTSKKDDFFGEFDAGFDLGDDDGDVDEHLDLNEDDLLMELDEMIND